MNIIEWIKNIGTDIISLYDLDDEDSEEYYTLSIKIEKTASMKFWGKDNYNITYIPYELKTGIKKFILQCLKDLFCTVIDEDEFPIYYDPWEDDEAYADRWDIKIKNDNEGRELKEIIKQYL